MLRQKCQKYWDIGSHLAVDEIMISFDGRSIQKVTIPAKPIPVGLKLQGLGDKGHIYSWEATRPKLAKFQQDTAKFSVPIPKTTTSPVYAFLTATQSMVARLVESLPKGRRFHLYLDNLFVCWCQAMSRLWLCQDPDTLPRQYPRHPSRSVHFLTHQV